MLIRKDVLKLTLPVVTEQVFIMSMGVVNAVMAGHIGKEAVSAIGMVDSISNIIIALFSSLAVGGTVVIAHYAGQDNIRDVNEAAKQALLSSTALSLLITLLIWLFRQPILHALYGSAEKEVMNNSLIYFSITLLTYPLISLTSAACGILRGSGDTRTPAKVTILMNAFNVLLSYVFIYGLNIGGPRFHIFMPAMRVQGAAIGISVSRTIGAVLIIYTLFRGLKNHKAH